MPKKKSKPEESRSKFTAEEEVQAKLKFVLSDPVIFHEVWNGLGGKTKQVIKDNPSLLLFYFEASGKVLTPNEVWELNHKFTDLDGLLAKFSETGI
jgi:hypothetical protein